MTRRRNQIDSKNRIIAKFERLAKEKIDKEEGKSSEERVKEIFVEEKESEMAPPSKPGQSGSGRNAGAGTENNAGSQEAMEKAILESVKYIGKNKLSKMRFTAAGRFCPIEGEHIPQKLAGLFCHNSVAGAIGMSTKINFLYWIEENGKYVQKEEKDACIRQFFKMFKIDEPKKLLDYDEQLFDTGNYRSTMSGSIWKKKLAAEIELMSDEMSYEDKFKVYEMSPWIRKFMDSTESCHVRGTMAALYPFLDRSINEETGVELWSNKLYQLKGENDAVFVSVADLRGGIPVPEE